MFFKLVIIINEVINILYCIDKNYNPQFNVSLYSILENIDVNVNVHVIHRDESDLNFVLKKVLKHKHLKNIKVYKFNKDIDHFPNLKNSHVSSATYFRLFIEDFLPNDLDNILYLDADVVCISNPKNTINNVFDNMKNNNNLIGAFTEIHRDLNSESLFLSLQMKSNNYFNAGVMFIDFKKWIAKGLSEKLQGNIEALASQIQFWDQDILNSYFDGDYYQINNSLNFVINLFYNCDDERNFNFENIKKQNIFVHFAGSHKPWTPIGSLSSTAEIYQEIYRVLFKTKYHITHKWKVNSLKTFLKAFFDGKILKLSFPISYLKLFFQSLIADVSLRNRNA